MLLQIGVFHKHPRNNTSPYQNKTSTRPLSWVLWLGLASLLALPRPAYAAQAWIQNSLSLAKQRAAGRLPLLLQVSAAWCTPCNQLHHEVLDTPAVSALLKQAIGVRFDFDTPEGQRITKNYAILNLPTTLLLDKKGREIGRIEGYPGRKEYLRHLNELLRGDGDFSQLQQLQKTRPLKNTEKLRWARALLVRGKHQDAYRVLAPMLFQPSLLGQQATRMWGRWLLRVQKRAKEAEAHFRHATNIYKKTSAHAGFLYWQANSLHQMGQTQKAMQLFFHWEARAPQKSLPPMLLADFLLHHRLSTRQARLAIQRAFRHIPLSSPLYKRRAPWLFYLSAQLYQRQAQRALAQQEIQRALRLSPKTAIYQNFARQLSPTPLLKNKL